MADEDDGVYLVDYIVSHKKVGRKTMYFVKWEGYESDQNTWEPCSNLSNVKHLIKEYNNRGSLDQNATEELINNQEVSTCSNAVA